MLSQLRQARYGYLLALHVLLLCAAGRTPTEIAAFLFCSRSSVYRIVSAYRCQSLGFAFTEDGHLQPPVRSSCLTPSVGVEHAGVAQLWLHNSKSIVASPSLPIPPVVGCINSAGFGSGPSSLLKMMIRNGSRSWHEFARFLSISALNNSCCLLMNLTSTCWPRSAISGWRKALSLKSARRAPTKRTIWSELLI